MTDKIYWTTTELCERYGRSPKTLHTWRKTKGFPDPVIQGGHGSDARYNIEDVTAWENKRRTKAA